MLRYIKYCAYLLIAGLFILFAVANREPITLTLFPLPYTAEMPKFLFAILVFGLGAIISGFALGARTARARRLYKAEHKRSQALANELEALKAAHSSTLPATHP